jgi:phosphatidylcholine synthase
VRVARLRWLTLILMAAWAALGLYVLVEDFNVEAPVTAALCLIAAYVVASDGVIRFLRSLKA